MEDRIMEDGITVMETSAGRVAVRVDGEGPTVLLVHGIPGSAGEWDQVSDGLVAAGFRVLVPDLLGFGASDRPVDPQRACGSMLRPACSPHCWRPHRPSPSSPSATTTERRSA
ncbi:MAG: alpha/beta hydrolase [Actinobacteria bacterium]|nr:alpha/beta hydrolase [Actinomycetota bacterium]